MIVDINFFKERTVKFNLANSNLLYLYLYIIIYKNIRI